MFRNCLIAIALIATPVWAADEDLKTAVDKSLKAMGADNLKTVVISGEGWDGCVGQAYDPNSPNWRKFSNKDYVRSIDFDARGWRLQRVRGLRRRRTGGVRRGAHSRFLAHLAGRARALGRNAPGLRQAAVS